VRAPDGSVSYYSKKQCFGHCFFVASQGSKGYIEIVEKLVYVVPLLPSEEILTYSVPPLLQKRAIPGSRALVPVGRRTLTGVIVGRAKKAPQESLREIADVLDSYPLINLELLRFTRWISRYYLCSWGDVLKASLPGGINIEGRKMVNLKVKVNPVSLNPFPSRIVSELKGGNLTLRTLSQRVGHKGLTTALAMLSQKGIVEITERVKPPQVRVLFVTYVSPKVRKIPENILKRAPQQARCLRILLNSPSPILKSTLRREHGIGDSVIASLAKKGLIRTYPKERLRDPYADLSPSPAPIHSLTTSQTKALSQINLPIEKREYRAFLLYGVASSGKTQIYIQAVKKVIKLGRRVLLLLPEVSLTPQMVTKFRSHFGSKVTILHSYLSPGERYDSWRKIREGSFDVVIGARSAIFAPLQGLGLIIVDEEHSSSYKQKEPSPRYNARDLAVVRAKLNRAVVILGSATPSIESLHNCQIGKYQLLRLPEMVEKRKLPLVFVVDMRAEGERGNWGIFSLILQEEMEKRLRDGQQVILFLNRRGFSTFIRCEECGFVAKCPRCSLTLTFHLQSHKLLCHYCGYREEAPVCCPKCRGQRIIYRGLGTQKVEAETKRLFPQYPLLRMDTDTTSRKGAHRQIYESFQRGEAQILLGTQMVAKGLHFPRVTLVGVISADTSLHLPDFRANERTFQLLAQVAGRAGRGPSAGLVVVQTYSPESTPVKLAAQYDYLGFYQGEIKLRGELSYPPFTHLVSFLIRGKDEAKVKERAEELANKLRGGEKDLPFTILGPAPAPLYRLREEFRWRILLKSEDEKRAKRTLRRLIVPIVHHPQQGVKITIDVDPQDMM